jgi:hypothetical protein
MSVPWWLLRWLSSKKTYISIAIEEPLKSNSYEKNNSFSIYAGMRTNAGYGPESRSDKV